MAVLQLAMEVKLRSSVANVLFSCPKCDESISSERFHGEPINFCHTCGVELTGAINWETKKKHLQAERDIYWAEKEAERKKGNGGLK